MPNVNLYRERLTCLRQAMAQAGADACLILSADPHASEYLPEFWQNRAWLTGFTGSAGTAVVTEQEARLWVDSRYWIAAEKALSGSGFVMEKAQGNPQQAAIEWLTQSLGNQGVVAIDAQTLTLAQQIHLNDQLKPIEGQIKDVDLFADIWTDRPELPQQPIYALTPEVAARSRADKIALVRTKMQTKGATHHLISALDDIAWLMNLRGRDVPFNPVFLSHVLLDAQSATLFTQLSKLSPALIEQLAADGVQVQPYENIHSVLSQLLADDVLLVDPNKVVASLMNAVCAQTVHALNPTTTLKARKTTAEMTNWRRVMRHDGAALCEFFAWLEHAIAERSQQWLTEIMVDEVLTSCRASQPGFVSRSFATIAAFGANAAMPHYMATQKSNTRIHGHGLLLIDSGGQYEGGTTDITRMVPVGNLSRAQREDCTAVLQGMIALSRLRVPQGTPAGLIDAVARAPLWARLVDYGHGTGHGVGYFLNVHEGPQSISYRAPIVPEAGLQPGMVTSNEPGLYRVSHWGVRIENLLHCQAAGDSEFGSFVEFETLTLCPIDTRCLLPELMRPDEIEWLNAYHAEVRGQLESLVSDDALEWLLERTQPLSV
ncbi:aminopeptidase P family protein [Orrella sp. 11846]|uniref:aminopeptidase P family protein n=1 Tax=Orrella sp. 11846 TaxID=3409913 RepID=UPI003B5CC9D8